MEFEELKSEYDPGRGLGVLTVMKYNHRARKSVILVCKKAQKANRCFFWLWESQENVLVF